MRSVVNIAVFIALLFVPFPALAGPPFLTDDPEPVEYKHWEIYFASMSEEQHGGVSMTAPHLDVNYGIAPNFQLHFTTPMEYVKPPGLPSHYGYGDTELGVKWRFFQNEDARFLASIYPLLEVPTGAESRGLGNGQAQVFLPLWLQKGWGPWQTYGGGGYWINPGDGHKDFGFLGWQVQREMSKCLTLGAELFYETPRDTADERHFGFNIGTIINVTEKHHILLSAGTDIIGPTDFYSYIAYQLTFGPEKQTGPAQTHLPAGRSSPGPL
ncbi:MAG: hypothetical protein ABSG91_25975 [Syntrophobacteraceae bacterium]